ncbi:hypothetical protein Tco_0930114 [Tanacetum coccineum]
MLLVKRLQNQKPQKRKLILKHLLRRRLLKLLKEKRIKSLAKGDKVAKKKQPAETSMDKGLTVLFDVALIEAEQLKLVIERSKTQTHRSYASGSGADEGTGDIPWVPDVPTDGSDDEQISWKSSEEDDEDEVNFSTHYDEARQEEVNEEDSFDPRVQTPSHDESIDDDNSDEKVQGTNTEEEEMVEEATHEEDEANELYRDVNVNLEGRDTVMTDVPLPNVQVTQETEDTHVILTALINPEGQQQNSSMSSGFVPNMLNPRTDAGIDLIFNTEETSLVDVPVTTIAESPLILKTLETYFSEFKQMNQFAKAVSSIPSIVDNYLANKMNEAIKTTVQLQSDRLREEAQAENKDLLNKLDDNIKKIIKDQVKEQVKAQVSKILPKIEKTVNKQLEAEVMTRSSTESKTSLAIAANLSKLELKKILIEKMESNKSINRSNEQKNLYKALVESYKNDKLILDTYGSKRIRAGKEPESTNAPKEKTSKTTGKSTDGSKSQHKSTGESAHTEEPMHTKKDLEEPVHQEFDIGDTEEQSDEETSQHPDWFQKPAKIPSFDRDWNKTLPAAYGPVQPWLSTLAQMEDLRESINELMDTPLDFSAFVMNRLKVDTLTLELLVGPTFELMKGSCKILLELEYHFEEVYKATTDQLDWNNPEGQQYPYDLQKPLPLIPNSRVTKTKAVDYGHIKWIEDLVPNRMWSQVLVSYDKHTLWGISHWGQKRQQLYGFVVNKESARDVYSKRRIIVITKIEIVKWHNYKHLDWITVRRDDDKLYKFKEGDFNRLRIQDIKDMLLLLVQGKLTNLTIEEFLAFNVSLRMFTRSVVIQRRLEDL